MQDVSSSVLTTFHVVCKGLASVRDLNSISLPPLQNLHLSYSRYRSYYIVRCYSAVLSAILLHVRLCLLSPACLLIQYFYLFRHKRVTLLTC
jgi:hypothetical protein